MHLPLTRKNSLRFGLTLKQEKNRPDGRIFSWSTEDDGYQTSAILESLYVILISYEIFKKRTERMKLLLDNIVKPESVTELKFLL